MSRAHSIGATISSPPFRVFPTARSTLYRSDDSAPSATDCWRIFFAYAVKTASKDHAFVRLRDFAMQNYVRINPEGSANSMVPIRDNYCAVCRVPYQQHRGQRLAFMNFFDLFSARPIIAVR